MSSVRFNSLNQLFCLKTNAFCEPTLENAAFLAGLLLKFPGETCHWFLLITSHLLPRRRSFFPSSKSETAVMALLKTTSYYEKAHQLAIYVV